MERFLEDGVKVAYDRQSWERAWWEIFYPVGSGLLQCTRLSRESSTEVFCLQAEITTC